jgi:hypothetical protein
MSEQEDRAEWLRLMTELAEVDRAEYRRIRAAAWAAIAAGHERKSSQELVAWVEKAS